MGSQDNRLRRKWQDYGGSNATVAEHNFVEVFEKFFEDTEYEVIPHPSIFNEIYVEVELSEEEMNQIYVPEKRVTKHGISPDAAIRNKNTGKIIFVELKRQDGWVEGKTRSAGRGNAHERLCKYFTPGLLKILRNKSKITATDYPFWIVFQGDITRDICRVKEITLWFDGNTDNYYFWRDTKNPLPLIEHFINHIVPLLEEEREG